MFIPMWAIWTGGGVTLLALLFAYGCGNANGWDAGSLSVRLDAIRAGVAKACDFDGGWRWHTRGELGRMYAGFSGPPPDSDNARP